jgi:renalase
MRPSPLASTAIIGAGIAGLACARALNDAGFPVTLFEKSRGPGGRLASRRLAEATLDLGAQFFSVRHEAFRREVMRWLAAGVAAPWPWKLWRIEDKHWRYRHDGGERYCGQPRMSAITRHLADGLTLHSECRIAGLSRRAHAWWLETESGETHGPFDRVAISCPSPQAMALLAPHDDTLAAECRAVEQRACWAAWACLDAPFPRVPGVEADWQAAQGQEGPLRFVSRNHLKPGRWAQGESLTLLALPEWSEQNLECEPSQVACMLFDALQQMLPAGVRLPRPTQLGAHRWRFAHPELPTASPKPTGQDYRLSPLGLGLCGDGWRGARVEDAWLSGHHLGLALATTSTGKALTT